jgi:hypothetical protein
LIDLAVDGPKRPVATRAFSLDEHPELGAMAHDAADSGEIVSLLQNGEKVAAIIPPEIAEALITLGDDENGELLTDLIDAENARREIPVRVSSGAPFIFLSGALGTDIKPAMLMLGRNGFRPMQWTQLPAEGVVRGLRDALKACTALVAVVDQAAVAPAVVLEIGAALGRGLPVVILAMNADAAADLEPALRELPVISVTGDSSAAGTRLAETLHALIEAHEAESGPASRSERTEQRTAVTQGRDFAANVAAILQERGARVVPELRGPDFGRHPDLAIWIDSLPHPSLNPVLIETKVRSKHHLPAAEEQLRELLAAYRCVLGLVVVPGDMPVEWHVTSESAVATIGSETLAQRDLVRLLNDGRNQWVHGVR